MKRHDLPPGPARPFLALAESVIPADVAAVMAWRRPGRPAAGLIHNFFRKISRVYITFFPFSHASPGLVAVWDFLPPALAAGAQELQQDFVQAAERVSPSVVSIKCERVVNVAPFGGIDEDFFRGTPFEDFFRSMGTQRECGRLARVPASSSIPAGIS